MNILYVVPYTPSRIRVRPYNLIRQLSSSGHRVTVLTSWTSDEEKQVVERLKAACDHVEAVYLPRWRSVLNCVLALPGQAPLQYVYSWSSELAHRVIRLASQADVVHVEHLRGARYGVFAMSTDRGSRAPIVWDSVDCISHLFEQASRKSRRRLSRMLAHFELPRTRQGEGWLLDRFAKVLVTSPIDREMLGRLRLSRDREVRGMGDSALVEPARHQNGIVVVPNGVDLDHFVPSDTMRDADLLVFTGKMSYHANITAAAHLIESVMPLVWTSRPSARLMIVGKDPPRMIRRLAESHGPRIKVTGEVPDLRPFLAMAALAVFPIQYGSGLQNKALEAMACATAVVTTPQGVAGLEAKSGQGVLIEERPEGLARCVVRLLGDSHEREAIGRAGRRYVESHHQWSDVAARLEEVYVEAIDSGR